MKSCILSRLAVLAVATTALAGAKGAAAQTCPNGGTTVYAHVVALDQPIVNNRLGASLPAGMVFALARDVCTPGQMVDGQTLCDGSQAPSAGNVVLKPYKRPRPISLRVNQGQCLKIGFTNLLSKSPVEQNGQPVQPTTRAASVHVQGMELVNTGSCGAGSTGPMCNDGSWVGDNPKPGGLVPPSSSPLSLQSPQITYTLYAAQEGAFLLYSTGDTFSNPPNASGDGGQLSFGLFGAVHVQPAGGEWYRSQVTAADLDAAVQRDSSGKKKLSPHGQPLINYAAVYKNTTSDPCFQQGTCRVGPVLAMSCGETANPAVLCYQPNEIVHSDLTAIITGPSAGRFQRTVPEPPTLQDSYSLPDRLQPYREFTIIYHEMFNVVQAFADYYSAAGPTGSGAGQDQFGINYGMGGIGSEILANRLGVGPMSNCTSCKFEEFFLTSWAVGDPAMVVDRKGFSCTAQATCPDGSSCDIANPDCPNQGACTLNTYECQNAPATRAFYPDDPSNVYHGYISDHTKFRVLHGGSDLHHVHHQHAHQWLHSPDTSNGDYLDSQSIGPGSAFSLEMTYNASGNVNQTVGDSIFHCHFYPHFAGGMWSLWRVHDVYETGTVLDGQGKPVTSHLPGTGMLVTNTRALPDGEIVTGTPIPALVPLPTLPMPPMPAKVVLAQNGTEVWACNVDSQGTTDCRSNLLPADGTDPKTWKNPGFPFYIPGIAGQRAPHPPLDFAKEDDGSLMDGGLPRHLIRPCAAGPNGCAEIAPLTDFTDFSKTLTKVDAFELPEGGTFVEQVAMNALSQRLVDSMTPEGATQTVNAYDPPALREAKFIQNGLPPVAGAPFADPCIEYTLDGGPPPWHFVRKYKAADIQLDATFNKAGWHFPQQRMLSLWGDVKDYLTRARPPEPFFFRANSGDCIEYTLANLVPNVYELDDFQVRTPTDIIGQHIHLVKFDVTSSDGATNGFNYEDGTFAPNEVLERIGAINQGGGLRPSATGQGTPRKLTAKPLQFFGPGPGGQWVGAQATIQRWYTDRLFDGTIQRPGVDRTLRTVFTHDHFGPSTHQQAGLYAGLVIEPRDSIWYHNESSATAPPFGGAGVTSRFDGGPTTWQAVIVPQDNPASSFREFLFEFQDTTLTYEKFDITPPNFKGFCSDNGAGCTPATAAQPQSGCSAGAVCYAYGFCSDSVANGAATQKCTTDPVANYLCGTCTNGRCQYNSQLTCGTSTSAIASCGGREATCNLVAGVPGANGAAGTTWGTKPLDSGGVELITLANATNSFSVNYRNEPLFPRIDNMTSATPSPGQAGDMSYAYASIERPNLPCAFPNNKNCDPYPTPLTPGVGANDPFTPLLRAYAGDDVQIRTLVGAHINPHNFTVHGVKWLNEPSFVDSGWRNSQVMGISEHFEEVFKLPSVSGAGDSDYLYMAGAAAIEQAGGNWGLMRGYASKQPDLRSLPQNPVDEGQKPKAAPVCPPGVTPKKYTVVALTAQQALGGPLVYNTRGPIQDPHAVLYYRLEDLEDCSPVSTSCKAKSSTVEPLVLRANAGDCLEVTLYNALALNAFCSTDSTPCTYGQSCGTGGTGTCQIYGACSGVSGAPPNTAVACTPQNAATQCTGTGNTCQPLSVASPINLCGAPGSLEACNANLSGTVGLHPQLVSFDVTTSSGFNAGNNPDQAVAPGQSRTYTWYAGNVDPKAPDGRQHIPIEFGAANLLPTDTLNHHQYGLFGALVIEPPGSVCVADDGTTQPIETCRGIKARINGRSGSFRELVLIFQDGLNGPNTAPSSTPFPLQAASLTSDNLNAISLRSEPLFIPGTPWRQCSDPNDLSCVLSKDAQCCTGANSGGCTFSACGGIQTPVLEACPGEQVRLRVLHGGGINTNHVFEIYGHSWQEQPYMSFGKGCPPPAPTTQSNLYSSSTIGTGNGCDPLEQDTFSEYQGSRMGHGPSNHFDVLIPSAGGANRVPGDYLYRSFPADHYRLGAWGVLRVTPNACIGAQGTQGAGAAAGGAGR